MLKLIKFIYDMSFFLFFAQSSGSNKTLFYVLVLSSLILSWVETWIFDAKVQLLLIHHKLL